MNASDPLEPPTVAAPLPVTAGASFVLDSPQFKNLLGLATAAVIKLIADAVSHWAPHLSALLLSITGSTIALIINDAVNAYIAIGVVVALRQRKNSTINPLKLTRAAAAAAPETKAVVKTQGLMAGAGIPTAVEELKASTQAAPNAAAIVNPPSESTSP